MKMTTFLTSILLAAAVFTTAVKAQNETEFRVGADPDYRPMAWTDATGKAVGYDIDFSTVLAEHLGRKLVHIGMAWDGIIPALQSKRIDAITSIVITDSRKEQVAFSQPVLEQKIIVVVPKNYSGPAPDAAQLKTMKVGVQINSVASNVLTELQVPAAAYNTAADLMNDLALGRIDAVAIESIGGSYIVSSAYADKVKVTDVSLSSSPQYIAVALRKEDTDLLAKVDAAITKMKSDGTLQGISTKWFGEAKVLAP